NIFGSFFIVRMAQSEASSRISRIIPVLMTPLSRTFYPPSSSQCTAKVSHFHGSSFPFISLIYLFAFLPFLAEKLVLSFPIRGSQPIPHFVSKLLMRGLADEQMS